ncbi:hypothetical protein P8F81_03800 [Kosakonia cowanii]|uniref:hypothetical protein n=1 Tax=Kosakonia cowanii TaxID=208223 RepID=UPI002DDCEA56|nr:hypothetical protein [Kosakonia cowanii]WRY60152.1 hypothetical protein P8F81_03800 [Kosakonia cowanii]
MEKENKLEFTFRFFCSHTIWLQLGILVVTAAWLSIAFHWPMIFLNENQYLYILSTQAQVLGAVYGLSLTGYVFLRNNQDRLIEQDDSLYEVITKIQIKDYALLLLITILSVLTIFSDILSLMTYNHHYRLTKIVIKNAASVFFVITMLLISYFILRALRSGQVAKVSKEIVQDLGNQKEYVIAVNSYVESLNDQIGEDDKDFYLYGKFMKVFVDVEENLRKKYSFFRKDTNSKSIKNLPLTLIVNDLIKIGLIKEPLGTDLRRIIQYRNALVHTNNEKPSVSMLNVLQSLKAQLDSIQY